MINTAPYMHVLEKLEEEEGDLCLIYQENNRNPTEKELGQSELPVKRKRPKTIRKYHFSEI